MQTNEDPNMKHAALFALALASQCTVCLAQEGNAEWKLAGDKQPAEPGLWQQPATLSWTRENGDTTGTMDADLRYVLKTGPTTTARGWAALSYSAGAYVHRDQAGSKPKNDRGFSVGVARSLRFGLADPTQDNSYANLKKIDFLNLSLTAKFGKTMVSDKDAAGNPTSFDKKSARLLALADYYRLPKIPDVERSPDFQFNLAGGAYHDRLSGVGGKSGNLTGLLARARVDVAFLGLDPSAVRISEGLGFTPTAYAAAQVEKDLADSGDRKKDRYTLYTLGLALNFARLDSSGLVPSLSLERSTGADLLTGRAKTGKTTLALGLAF
jgi:hypothetical protein